MTMNLPTLSIITVGLNCESILKQCYSRLVTQEYPKDKIEILLIDGGSKDGTIKVAESFGARVIAGGYKNNQEARRFVGYQQSKNEILVYLDADNLLPNNLWLMRMVQPFMELPEIVGTQTLRYGYERDQSVMNRYFALFGMNDPVAFYLNKADRLPWYNNNWNLLGEVIRENENYLEIKFKADNLPTIGCNGFLIRRSVFDKLNYKPEDFFHTDVHVDFINMGYDKYAVVKTNVIHATGDTFLKSIRKRLSYMNVHHREMESRRKYKVFDSNNIKDILNLLKFVIFTITFIVPFSQSLFGFIKKRDLAWFVHPFVCLGFLLVYGYSTTRSITNKLFKSQAEAKGIA